MENSKFPLKNCLGEGPQETEASIDYAINRSYDSLRVFIDGSQSVECTNITQKLQYSDCFLCQATLRKVMKHCSGISGMQGNLSFYLCLTSQARSDPEPAVQALLRQAF